jgi:hypothetical protein
MTQAAAIVLISKMNWGKNDRERRTNWIPSVRIKGLEEKIEISKETTFATSAEKATDRFDSWKT